MAYKSALVVETTTVFTSPYGPIGPGPNGLEVPINSKSSIALRADVKVSAGNCDSLTLQTFNGYAWEDVSAFPASGTTSSLKFNVGNNASLIPLGSKVRIITTADVTVDNATITYDR
jgi:hypothetical protein